MSRSSLVFWDEHATGYDFGLGHPMRPLRLELTMALARGLSLFDAPEVRVAAAGPAEEEQLTRVHTPAYIGAVRRASAGEATPAFGLGTADNPIFPGMHQAASAAAGASVAAAQALWRGEAEHAVNLAGGLHHAMPAAASGFCVYNDGAVAIAELLAAGATRVAYVDLDAHHGDGVQHAFYADPRVLTISLHQTGLTLWPGTGFPGESGAGDARGMSVNVALPGGTGDAGWLRAFTAIVPPLLRAFEPQVLLTQFGCDGHRLDIMSDLELSVDGMRTAYRILHELAHEVAAGRWLVLGGGGYESIRVVPRAWCHALSEVVGVPLPADAPPQWVTAAQAHTARPVPAALHDGPEVGYEPWQWGAGSPSRAVDRAVMATRKAVFPENGLDVMAEGGEV